MIIVNICRGKRCCEELVEHKSVYPKAFEYRLLSGLHNGNNYRVEED